MFVVRKKRKKKKKGGHENLKLFYRLLHMVQSAAERKDQNKGSKLVKNKAHMGLLWFFGFISKHSAPQL